MNIRDINAQRGVGIPYARNVDHTAITVPDLEEACRFFVTHIGATLLYVEGPIRRGSWMRVHLNVHPLASCRVALLRLGPTCNLELFEYTSPDQNTTSPRNSDIGGHHIAIYVDNMDAAYDYVRTIEGVICQGTPSLITDGPIAGTRWLYFSTPWGLQMELVSPPARLPYEDTVTERRSGPHHVPWTDSL